VSEDGDVVQRINHFAPAGHDEFGVALYCVSAYIKPPSGATVCKHQPTSERNVPVPFPRPRQSEVCHGRLKKTRVVSAKRNGYKRKI